MKCPRCGEKMQTTGTRKRWNDAALHYRRCKVCGFSLAVKVSVVEIIVWTKENMPEQ